MKRQVLVICSDDVGVEDIEKLKEEFRKALKADPYTLPILQVSSGDDVKVLEIEIPDTLKIPDAP